MNYVRFITKANMCACQTQASSAVRHLANSSLFMSVRNTTFGTSLWGKGNSKRYERQLLGTSVRNVTIPEDIHSIPTQFEIRECRHNNFVI